MDPTQALEEYYWLAFAARRAGNRRGVQSLANRILSIDMDEQRAWRLLYEELNTGEPFEDFVQAYQKRHFPEALETE